MELLLIAALVLGLGWYVWRKRSQAQTSPKPTGSRGKPKQRPLEALDTVISWQPQATRVLTGAERKVTRHGSYRFVPLCTGGDRM